MKKKLIAFSLIAVCFLLFGACSSEEEQPEFVVSSPLRSQPSLENNVNMIAADIDRGGNQMIVTIFNNSEYELITGLHFMVEAFDGTDWRTVPWYGTFTGLFADIGYDILPYDSIDFTKNLELVETLSPGLYRIRKNVFRYIDRPISDDDIHDVVAEFYW